MSIYGQYDIRGILGDQTAEDIIEKAKATKVFLAEITRVLSNQNNIYGTKSDEIELLANDISFTGLLHELVAYKMADNYILISGHRRLAALNKLFAEGFHYFYHGMDITGKVPLTLIDKPETSTEEGLLIVSANNQRILSATEKKHVIKLTLSWLKSLEEEGKYSWPKGVRTCTVLAEKTGISEHFIKDYLAKTGLSKSSDYSDEQLEGKDPEVEREEKKVKNLKQSIRTLDKRITDFTWDCLSQMDKQQTEEIISQLQALSSHLQDCIKDITWRSAT